MKAKNHIIYDDQETLKRLKAEYEYIGRVCELRDDRLIVFALPPHKSKNKLKKRPDKSYSASTNWSKTERNFGYTRG